MVSVRTNQLHEANAEMEHGEYKENQLHEADTEMEHSEYKYESVT